MWLIYAVLLVADATVLVNKAMRDLDSEIWVRQQPTRSHGVCLVCAPRVAY